MKKYLYLAIAAICLGLSACSSDDDDEPKQLEQKKTGEENITDPAVTGGVQEVYLEGDDRNVAISGKIVGYLNLSDTLKLAIGMAPVYGVEMSTNESFPENETHQFSAKRMDDNRKFTITATGLKENTKYYYRTYLTNTIFGKTETFTTESYEAVAAKMSVPTADATNIRENSASVAVSEIRTSVAYTADKSLLTAANLKKAAQGNAVNGLNLSNGNLINLASGTTYYYCEFLKLATYIILGEVKSFTTSGYNAQDLAKQMTINASLNTTTQMWNVSIQSSLSMPGKTTKYGITHKMTSSYRDDVKATWMYRYTGSDWKTNWDVYKFSSSYSRGGTLYGAVVFDKTVYAEGSNNNYQASIENPYYNGIYYNNEYEGKQYIENWWDYCLDEFLYEFNLPVFVELKERINAGVATDSEYREYEDLYGTYAGVINNLNYSNYAKCYLQVFVEIDGVRYVVKEKEGKLRVPTLEDNPIDFNYVYDSNNNNDNDKDDDKDEPKPEA